MSKWQTLFALLWICMHTIGLPWIMSKIPGIYNYDEATLNFALYAFSAAALVIGCWTFMKRDYNTLCDNFRRTLFTIIRCFAMIVAFDLLLTGILSLFQVVSGADIEIANENNDAITTMAGSNYGMIAAASVFLAPIAEEIMFRGAVFGTLRRKNRVLAYAVSMILFSVYHVWSYAISDPSYWWYTLQYLPVSFVICFCYEQSNTIWGSILFHMIWNGVTLYALQALGEMI